VEREAKGQEKDSADVSEGDAVEVEDISAEFEVASEEKNKVVLHESQPK